MGQVSALVELHYFSHLLDFNIISVIAIVFCPPSPPWHRGDNLAFILDMIFK